MDAHDRRKLDNLKNFRFGGACFQSVLDMATHAGSVQMGGRDIDRDEDHFLVFLF